MTCEGYRDKMHNNMNDDSARDEILPTDIRRYYRNDEEIFKFMTLL